MSIRKRARRNYLFEIIIVIIALVLVRNLYITLYKNKTYSIKDTIDYQYKVSSRAILARDEYVYSTGESVQYDNATRQPVGTKISLSSNGKQEFFEPPEYYQNKLSKLDQKVNETSRLTQDKMNNIRENILNRNFREVSTKLSTLSSGNNLDDWEIKRQKYKVAIELIEKQGNNLVLLVAGNLSHYVDLYEDIYSYDKIFAFKDDYYIDPDIKVEEPAARGLKVINEMSYYMLFSVDNKKLKNNYSKGMPIVIKVKGNIYRGTVNNVYIRNGKTYFICKFEEGIKNFEFIRITDVEIINNQVKSYEIKRSSIVHSGNQKGVYIKAPTGVVTYRPIEVLDENKNNVVINAGKDGIITISNKQLKTVQIFDQIFENPRSLNEGELIE